MFVRLFYILRKYGVPVSTRELIDLNQAVAQGLVFADQEEFYQLVKTIMVKDERFFDKYDRAMKDYFDGIQSFDLDDLLNQVKKLPKDWFDLELLEKHLSPEQREALKKAGSLEELMKMLEERLREQHKKHQGGNRMIGTGGTSPFGAFGDHPEGVRIGGPGRKRSAVKVWEQRNYQNLDDEQILGTRHMQLALRRLRKFARQGAAEELDIQGTIRETAKQGILDVQLVPERRNRIKVLMLFDIGGSMDAHIAQCEQLFSAAKSEFKTLDYFYFHNCLYDYVWKDNKRRSTSRMSTWDLLNTYGRDYRVIVVGDASMAPYEIRSVGGSVEYMNEEPGELWLKRLHQHFEKTAWLNPEEKNYWQYTQSIGLIEQIFEKHMYPMTLKGIEDMTKYLAR
ncbi:vWA domain-containing protein [Acinetobacter pullicarnis]|uniref:vWA domain-containing protein n=1 Tax=Acinetobacter pullicarnis TaxID=2576829 RepID=UPI00111E3CED|nr:VWA domain-containing protein [Acinetobacter pullicarnis]